MQRNILATFGLIALSSAHVFADSPIIEWTTASGGNGHFYQLVSSNLNFDDARTAAATQSYNGLPGRLAIFDTANYDAERNFVVNNVYIPNSAGTNSGYWIGAFNLAETFADRYSNWIWIDGASVPTSITNAWNIDLFEGEGYNGATLYNNSQTVWDYKANNPSNLANGYIIEFAALPEPTAITLLAPATLLLARRRKA